MYSPSSIKKCCMAQYQGLKPLKNVKSNKIGMWYLWVKSPKVPRSRKMVRKRVAPHDDQSRDWVQLAFATLQLLNLPVAEPWQNHLLRVTIFRKHVNCLAHRDDPSGRRRTSEKRVIFAENEKARHVLRRFLGVVCAEGAPQYVVDGKSRDKRASGDCNGDDVFERDGEGGEVFKGSTLR